MIKILHPLIIDVIDWGLYTALILFVQNKVVSFYHS